jgi:phosphoserine phosphatase
MHGPQLVRCSGVDRPGITAAVLGSLDEAGAVLLEMDQIVVRGQLTLDLLVDGIGPDELRAALATLIARMELHVSIAPAPDADGAPVSGARSVVTVIAPQLGAAALAVVTGAIATSGANIERIHRLARRPVCAFEFRVTGGDPATLRSVLLDASAAHGLDVAVQPERLERRAKRLVVLDVDSTLIRDEVIELIAAQVGCEDEVAAITARAMAGELDFEASLRERVALLEGATVADLDAAGARVRLTPGARTLVGTLPASRVHRRGRLRWLPPRRRPAGGRPRDRARRREHARGRRRTPHRRARRRGPRPCGQGARARAHRRARAGAARADHRDRRRRERPRHDRHAGLGIAFNAKPAVRAAADTALNVPRLDAILFLLGIHIDEIVIAPDDASDESALAELSALRAMEGSD